MLKAQRKRKRLLNQLTLSEKAQYTQRYNLAHAKILNQYGFVANPTKSTHQNFKYYIHNKPTLPAPYPNNLIFHNLCTDIQPPTGTKKLLGLGLKFCTHSPTYSPNTNQSLLKLAYSIHTKNSKKQTTTQNTFPNSTSKLKAGTHHLHL